MSTKKRISLTLTERQYAALKTISDNSEQSMSGFVTEMIEKSLPMIERMGETLRKIRNVNNSIDSITKPN